jgi:ubiquinone/menaquinone biosynthesis C-methylase UbiE
MENLPWPDDSFDAATGFNAFQRTLDIGLALAAARRVARPRADRHLKPGPARAQRVLRPLASLGARVPVVMTCLRRTR